MKIILSLVLWMAAGMASADPKPGTESRAWIDLQKSGQSASTVARPQAGDLAGKSYDRYAKTFDREIPSAYSRESVSGPQGGGSSSK